MPSVASQFSERWCLGPLLQVGRETRVRRPPFPTLVLVSPHEMNSSERQTRVVEMRWQVYFGNTQEHKAASRHPASLSAPHVEERKLLVSLLEDSEFVLYT